MEPRLSVLIADDEKMAREGMKAYIPWEELGMQTPDCVENGAQVLDHLRAHPVDLLIMDVRMPVMDGLETLEQINRMNADVLVIVVSAYDHFEYAQRAIRSHLVFDYILKPIKRSSFCELLKKAAEEIRGRKAPPHGAWTSARQEQVLHTFVSELQRGDTASALATVRECAAQTDAGDEMAVFELKKTLLGLCAELNLATNGAKNVSAAYINDFDLLSSFNKCTTPDELYAYFRVLVKNAEPFLQSGAAQRPDSKSGAVISQCIAQINAQYADSQFSLQMLAEQMRLNTSYLSTLFKKETGIGFVRYLNTLRVERAKQLLKNMSYRTNEVALLVGVENSRYFAKIFKEMTGLSPSEYRVRYADGAAPRRKDASGEN